MAPPHRQGGGGLTPRTLAIASLASLTAAIVTREVFPAGTVYTAALTPVIVAAVSEMLNRPVDRMAELRSQRRTMVLEAREAEVARRLGEEPNPLRGAPDFAQGAEGFDDVATENGHRAGRDPLERARVYGPPRRRRILHPKVWIATGLAAFVIAAAVLTLPELIFGGAVATNHRTTLFGGGGHHAAPSKPSTQTTTTTKSETVPTVTAPPAGTQTQTTTDTGTATGTTPTSTDTGTSTTTTTSTSTGTATTPLPAQP